MIRAKTSMHKPPSIRLRGAAKAPLKSMGYRHPQGMQKPHASDSQVRPSAGTTNRLS